MSDQVAIYVGDGPTLLTCTTEDCKESYMPTTATKKNGKAKSTKGSKLLFGYLTKFGSYELAANDFCKKTKCHATKASLSHWSVGSHKPSLQKAMALEKWASIPFSAWYER